MPFRVPAPAARGARLAEADARWTAMAAAQPDLAPAVALQRRLIGTLLDLADVIDHGRLPRLSLPPRYLAAKLTRGVPALCGEPIPVPAAALEPSLLRLCDELSAGGAGQPADRIKAALVEARMDAGSLLVASLHRDQRAIRAAAVQHDLAADLLWLVAELAASPFAHALQRLALGGAAADAALGPALEAWGRGFCPACGSWPALAEMLDGSRVLRCSFCACAWEPGRDACAYCGAAPLPTIAPDARRPAQQFEACPSCRGYLKQVPVDHLSPFPLLAIADLETMALDAAAMQGGFSRPQMREAR
jgi:FdhE protein